MALLSRLHTRNTNEKRRRRPTTSRARLHIQVLEDRCMFSGYTQFNLAGFVPGTGHFTDANLNGWGMTGMPDGSFCVANPFSTGLATFYNRAGHVLPQTISVPASAAQPFGPIGQPAGVIYNSTSDFVITAHGKSAPARLIFDSIDGVISGWNPDVDATHAIVIMDTFAAGNPAVYTGLDIAKNSQGHTVLYAADILQSRVEMFDGGFNAIGSFTDPTATSVDAGFGAWSVSAVNDKLYVTFANPFSPVSGPHGGVVDVFNTDGQMLNRLSANAPGAGPLENPWGITQAPANFGAYSNDLLVGNVAGAGNINVFDTNSGAYLGQLRQPNGAPVAITGLWDLEFGDGTPDSGKTNQLFFDAGPNAPGVSGYGLFGVIRAAGDQSGNGAGHTLPTLAATLQNMQQTPIPQVQPVVQQAAADWAKADAAAPQWAQPHQETVAVRALSPVQLGEDSGSQVEIHPNAAAVVSMLDSSTRTSRTNLRSALDHVFATWSSWKRVTTLDSAG
jgi:uncharacterized protein (TIGR03118 family)